MYLKINIPGNSITIKTDSFPVLSKKAMFFVLFILLIIFDVMINSNNFKTIIKINHAGIIFKYANIIKNDIVYIVSEMISNLAPMLDVQLNNLAK